MRLLFIILLLSTMLFSNQKQIILGSFAKEQNALNDLERLSKYVIEDKKLSKLLTDNSMSVEFEKIGDYYVVALSPLQSYPSLFAILGRLNKYYDDAYVLEYTLVQEVIEEEVIEEEIVIPVKTVTKEKIIEKEIVIPEKEAYKPQVKTAPKKIAPSESYLLEISLLVLALVVLSGLIFIILKRRKKEEN